MYLLIGPPLPPNFNTSVVHLVNNSFLHTINWGAPFTWTDFPVTEYTINITNISNGELVSTTIPVNLNETSISVSYFNYSFVSDGSSCYDLDIALSATNSIGESEASTGLVHHLLGRPSFHLCVLL